MQTTQHATIAMTMLAFLQQSKDSRDLDKDQFKHRFPEGSHKADFLLWRNRVVCEHKAIEAVQMQARIEKLWKKGKLPKDVFEREVYTSLVAKLTDADQQIGDTKRQLNLKRALGFVILENRMPDVVSGPILIGATDRAMLAGLHNVDGTLCMDLVNYYKVSTGGSVRFTRLVLRPGRRSRRLATLVYPFLKDYCRAAGVPFVETGSITKFDLSWLVDDAGKYVKHQASFS